MQATVAVGNWKWHMIVRHVHLPLRSTNKSTAGFGGWLTPGLLSPDLVVKWFGRYAQRFSSEGAGEAFLAVMPCFC